MKFDYLNRSLDISPGPVGAVFLQTLKSNAKKVFLLGTALDTITRLPNYFFNLHEPHHRCEFSDFFGVPFWHKRYKHGSAPRPVGSVCNRTGPDAGILKTSKPLHSFLQRKPRSQAQNAPAENHCLDTRGAEGVQKEIDLFGNPTSFLLKVRFGFKPNLLCLGPQGHLS